MSEQNAAYVIEEPVSSTVNEPYLTEDKLLPHTEAERLLQLQKKRVNDDQITYPDAGDSLEVLLISLDETEQFKLTIQPGKIDIYKTSDQLREKTTNIILARLDLGNVAHRNPDDELIIGPHIHFYKEGHADRFARPIDPDVFTDPDDPWKTLQEFMAFCNIIKKPIIVKGADQW